MKTKYYIGRQRAGHIYTFGYYGWCADGWSRADGVEDASFWGLCWNGWTFGLTRLRTEMPEDIYEEEV